MAAFAHPEHLCYHPPMTPAPDALYVQHATMSRLMAQERVLLLDQDGKTHAFFRQYDHLFPGRQVYVSTLVTENAAHIKKWSPSERRFVYEFVADV